MFSFSDDQEIAFNKISNWLKKNIDQDQKVLTLSGYAGTGKSTIVSHIAKSFDKNIKFAFCALSGRAASVLRKKIIDQGLSINNEERHYCGTVHKLIYQPISNKKGEVIAWKKKDHIDYDVIVLDEASMISEKIFNDLLFYNKKILAVGDHGQLPPIEGKFSLMKLADIKLEKIHRQAEDNPIIQLSYEIRKTGKINQALKSKNISFIKKSEFNSFINELYVPDITPEQLLDISLICYKNSTRKNINSIIRKALKKPENHPEKDDIVICLKNYDKNVSAPVYNGFRGYIDDDVIEADNTYYLWLCFPFDYDGKYLFEANKYQFEIDKTASSFDDFNKFGFEPKSWGEVGHLFDYGYAMTCHKSQGSSFNEVVIFNERPYMVDDETYKKWLYTAVTRSSNNLTIII